MSTKKNAAYNVAYRMFSVFLPLVTAPYLSRTVGTDGVGLYSLAWSVSYVFCLVGMLGLNDYGVRTIAQVRDDRSRLDRTFSAIWKMQLPSSGFSLMSRCEGCIGLVLMYLLCSRLAQNLTRRGREPFRFLLTPMTSSKKCSASKSGF